MSPTKKIEVRQLEMSSTIETITHKSPEVKPINDLSIFIYDDCKEVRDAIATFLSNGPVCIQDFMAIYKKQRALMYAARGGR